MEKIQLPLILSPGPGCPEIISLKNNRPITVIVASTEAPCFVWNLTPSASNLAAYLKPITLSQGELSEIEEFSAPSELCTVDGTRLALTKELLRLLESEARIFKVTLWIPEVTLSQGALRNVDGEPRPAIYDLCMGSYVKPHAVCLTATDENGAHFIHLTDLHLARRNDLIRAEVSSTIGPADNLNNFNQNFRNFICKANSLSDSAELDFVLIGGDIVDFVNQGVSDSGLEDDNNWRVFIEILTGGGNESESGNPGINVPVFTTTGNHDWRLHPYDILNLSASFAIDRKQAAGFDSEYYDTVTRLNEKKNEVYNKIVKEGTFVTRGTTHKTLRWLLGKLETWEAKALIPAITAVLSYLTIDSDALSAIPSKFIIGFDALSAGQKQIFFTAAITILATGVHYAVNSFLFWLISRIIVDAIIPIEAGVQALHYYFLNINPYMNYAFSFGPNYFILMDTGPDCFVGQYLWDDGNKKMSRLSIKDNILGGSPDSMGFYGINEYYSYGQISWLEDVLKAIGSGKRQNSTKTRIFICLHAPPVNIKDKLDLGEKDEVLLIENLVKIRYGTINHFLSQFFHLCLGEKEHSKWYQGPKVDMVLTGHAHQKIEFRLASGPLVYLGRYSDSGLNDFDAKRPFVLQTAACGPWNKAFQSPPYYRKVHVDSAGEIHSFKQTKTRQRLCLQRRLPVIRLYD